MIGDKMRRYSNYDTKFSGKFDLNKLLSNDHYEYLKKFSDTRRVSRKPDIVKKMSDVSRKKVNLPIGEEAQYFVGAIGAELKGKDESIIDYNQPPKSQPSLWCQWTPSPDKKSIIWDGGDSFVEYTKWIEYLINHFLSPWGYTLNGCVKFQGDSREDVGKIKIINNQVELFDLKVLA